MRQKKERSDNRRALPKFLLGLLGAPWAAECLGFLPGSAPTWSWGSP